MSATATAISPLSPGMSAPGMNAAAVTPSDGTDLATVARYLYVGTAGDVVVITAAGNTVTFSSHPVGYLRCLVARVKSTGTTASNILAIW